MPDEPTPKDWTQAFFGGAWLGQQLQGYEAEKNTREADFIEGTLALSPGAKVLDLPCGEGRLAIELAARGYMLTGLDFNPPVVAQAKERAAERKVSVDFQVGDMRRLAYDGEFDAVLNWFGSFGYFDEATNLEVAKGFARALKPGGKLLIDFQVLETVLPKYTTRGWSETKDGAKILEERCYDPATGRIESTWTWIKDGKEESYDLSLRIYSFRELAELLRSAGFREVTGYETLTGKPLVVGSSRCTAVAVK
ncbi:MAG: class I SAM-dependent methyltransferase [Planctomycetes bacterium]|nr:class I SAM-dependent methyltransferase [Planctomycetota bacterium]